MATHYPDTSAASELVPGWATPRPTRSAFALVLDHARRRASLRRRGPMPERRIAYLLRTLTAFRRQAEWLGLLGRSRAIRAAAEFNPRLYERWQAPYISRDFDLATCARVVDAHYRFIAREFPERLRERLMKGHDVRLATLPLGGGEMAYLHARAPENEATGELGLFLLNGDKEVISSCAITFGGPDGLIVGDMRGSWAYLGRGAIARFIRATDGLRPRDLLLAVVRALATYYGIDRVRGVTRASHPLGRRAGVTTASYERFWRRHGGVPGADGCYEVPCLSPSQGTTARDAFRRDACEVALRAFSTAQKS